MKATTIFLLAAFTAAAPAAAHHSFAPFDRSKEVTLTGAVKEFQWTNPHAWIQIMVKDDQGRETEWDIECAPANMMARTGWNKSTIKPGDAVVATVNPMRDGRSSGALVTITLPDGTVLGPGDAPKPLPIR